MSAEKWERKAYEDEHFETYKAIEKLIITASASATTAITERHARHERDPNKDVCMRCITMQNVMKNALFVLREATDRVSATLMRVLPTSFKTMDDRDTFDRRPLSLLAHSFAIARDSGDHEKEWESVLVDTLSACQSSRWRISNASRCISGSISTSP